jgi:peptide subunit release factor RF-3
MMNDVQRAAYRKAYDNLKTKQLRGTKLTLTEETLIAAFEELQTQQLKIAAFTRQIDVFETRLNNLITMMEKQNEPRT